jgi:hypothetical protein
VPRTVRAGDLIFLHPLDAGRVIQFDWDDRALTTGVTITTSTWTITATKQAVSTAALTNDNSSILSGSRKTQTRLIATTATDGDSYRLINTIVTNESPTQTVNSESPVFITIQAPRH